MPGRSLLLFGPGPCLVVILVLCLSGASFGCVFASDWLAYLLLIGRPTCFWLIGLLVPLCALLAHSALTLACHLLQTHPLVLLFSFSFLIFLILILICADSFICTVSLTQASTKMAEAWARLIQEFQLLWASGKSANLV